MYVFQPSAITANDRLLATFGESGEIMSLMWPRRDGPNNVREALLGLYANGHIRWTFDPQWQRSQSYDLASHAVTTTFRLPDEGIELSITDSMVDDFAVLARDIRVRMTWPSEDARVVFAAQVSMGGDPTQQGGWLAGPTGPVVVQGRAGTLAVGGTPFDDLQVHRWGDPEEGSKFNVEHGVFMGSDLVIGRVDFAVGWRVRKPVDENRFRLLLCLDEDHKLALRRLDDATDYPGSGGEGSRRSRRSRGRRANDSESDADLGMEEPRTPGREYIAERARILLEELREPTSGCWIAAPEFDPEYLGSGGYAYCWPRDGADMLRTAIDEGRSDWATEFLDWLTRTQEDDGYWQQRYWTDGKMAPSWCMSLTGLQLDEPAAVVATVCEYLLDLPVGRPSDVTEHYAPMAASAARYLLTRIDPATHLHDPAWDLWETFRGSFTYTNAVVAYALDKAGAALQTLHSGLASECVSAAQQLRSETIKQLWRKGSFVRGTDLAGKIDPALDAAAFGAMGSFGLLDLDDQQERDMAKRCALTMAKLLAVATPWGEGVARFLNDGYARGAASTVGTLWLAELLLRIAERTRETELVDKADAYLRAIEGSVTATGLISEFFGGELGRWVPAHGWSSALYLRDLRLLAHVRALLEDDSRERAVG